MEVGENNMFAVFDEIRFQKLKMEEVLSRSLWTTHLLSNHKIPMAFKIAAAV